MHFKAFALALHVVEGLHVQNYILITGLCLFLLARPRDKERVVIVFFVAPISATCTCICLYVIKMSESKRQLN